MRVHPAAEIFPMMAEPELAALADSIRKTGQLHPIIMFNDMLLDGRNRMAACKRAGVQPRVEELKRCDSPTSFVLAANKDRRHLTAAQLSAVAVDVAPLLAEEARAAQKAAGVHGVKGAEHGSKGGRGHVVTKPPSPQSTGKGVGQSAHAGKGDKHAGETTRKAAAAVGAGQRNTETMAAVKKAAPEVFEAVKTGLVPTVADAKRVAGLEPEERKAVMAKLGDVESVAAAVRDVKREKLKAELEDVAAQEIKAAEGVYDVVVVDPPWPIAKIERDARPNQVELDYPIMSLDELRELAIPCADDAHVWLWTTHRFLPDAFGLLEVWKLKYVCCFVWHKPGGFQPVGLPQFNCEFALYARRGTPAFVDTKAFPVAFEAPRGKHSEKPESFYDVVRRVTAGRRLDMFNRRPIDGFDTWGNQRG